jgi:aspartyl/asparaginyl beta-hydroxylase (cupin superfamily)
MQFERILIGAKARSMMSSSASAGQWQRTGIKIYLVMHPEDIQQCRDA